MERELGKSTEFVSATLECARKVLVLAPSPSTHTLWNLSIYISRDRLCTLTGHRRSVLAGPGSLSSSSSSSGTLFAGYHTYSGFPCNSRGIPARPGTSVCPVIAGPDLFLPRGRVTHRRLALFNATRVAISGLSRPGPDAPACPARSIALRFPEENRTTAGRT